MQVAHNSKVNGFIAVINLTNDLSVSHGVQYVSICKSGLNIIHIVISVLRVLSLFMSSICYSVVLMQKSFFSVYFLVHSQSLCLSDSVFIFLRLWRIFPRIFLLVLN